jgi:hypothetical protein
MGIPCFMGPRFSPKMIYDFLGEISYLMMLSGTLEGSMLWLLGQSCVFL